MVRERQPLPLEVLIFDMDGVLVDVSKSYREVIRRTVHVYLSEVLGLKVGRPAPVSHETISLFKSAGGFNNDWELTSALLLSLISRSRVPPLPRGRDFSKIPDAVRYLRDKVSESSARGVHAWPRKTLSCFLEEVKACGGGLRGVHHALKRNRNASWKGWVCDQGALDQGNIVQRIFQEIYLGRQFLHHYRVPPLFYRGPGYHLREELLIPKRTLRALHRKLRLGIATGRPRFEAELALKRFHIADCFDAMVTLDECYAEEHRVFEAWGRRERRTKPHPYLLVRVIREMGLSNPRCGYLGDTVDDMRAARSAGRNVDMTAIGFLRDRRDMEIHRAALFEAGARVVIEHPRDLLSL